MYRSLSVAPVDPKGLVRDVENAVAGRGALGAGFAAGAAAAAAAGTLSNTFEPGAL